MNNIEKARLDKNWKWCQIYWERKSKELKVQDWGFQMNHAKLSLAICNYTKRTIFVSSYFLRGENCNEKSMRNSILHEIAHALAGSKNGHNSEWERIALSIGCDGNRCGKMDVPVGNYVMYCENKCFRKEYHRKPKVNGRICMKCKSTPKIKIIEKIEQKKEHKVDHLTNNIHPIKLPPLPNNIPIKLPPLPNNIPIKLPPIILPPLPNL